MLIFLAGLVLAVAGGVLWQRKTAGREGSGGLLVVLLPAGLYLAGFMLCGLFRHPLSQLSSERLALLMAWLQGHPLYTGLGKGPAVNAIYPPLFYLFYLPVVLAGFSDLTVAFIRIQSILFCSFPVFLVFWSSGKRRNVSFLALTAGSLLFLIMLLSLAPFSALSFVYAEVPALGCAMLACYFVMLFLRRPDRPLFLWLSALFCVLSAWCKQPMVFLAPGVLFYVYLVSGPRLFLRYLLRLVLWASVSLVVFVPLFGFGELYYNLVELPLRFECADASLVTAFVYCKKLVRFLFIPATLLTWFILNEWTSERRGRPASAWFADNEWMLLLIAGLFLVPVAVSGQSIIGAGLNHFSYPLYFIYSAVVLMLIGESGREPKPEAHGRKQARVLLAGTLFLMCVFSVFKIAVLLESGQFDREDHNAQAYRCAVRYPGRFYFPNLPLAHWLAEGKLYHNASGLLDHYVAGLPVSRDYLRRYTPERMQYVAAYNRLYYGILDDMRLFPEFTQQTAVEELPGWIVYTRAANGAPAEEQAPRPL